MMTTLTSAKGVALNAVKTWQGGRAALFRGAARAARGAEGCVARGGAGRADLVRRWEDGLAPPLRCGPGG
jgi:hypothetical protein